MAEAVYEVPDSEEETLFDPEVYSFNAFWSSGHVPSRQSIKAIIRNYLSAMNSADIKIVVKQFGIGRVRSELVQMFKEDYKRGFVDIKGMHACIFKRQMGQKPGVFTDQQDAFRKKVKKEIRAFMASLKQPTQDEAVYLREKEPKPVAYDDLQNDLLEMFSAFSR